MVMKVFVLALALAVTFFQSLHGVFSALIMLVLSVLCSAFALTHYEWLNQAFFASFMPEYGQAVALAALFVVPLGLLRFGIDKVISGNMVLPALVDRIGAPVLGLGTGLIVSGMIALVFQLLPFDPDLLGFQRIVEVHNGEPVPATARLEDIPLGSDVEFERNSLWLSPDGLTASLASKLSANAFGTEPNFAEVHPDYLAELHWRRFGTQRESRDWVAPDSLSVRDAKVLGNNDLWIFKKPDQSFNSSSEKLVPDTTRPPADGDHYVAVTVTMPNDKEKTADSDGTIRFRGGQFRLVCRDPRTGETFDFPMSGICYKPGAFGDEGKWQYFNQYRGTIIRGTGEGLGVAFEVPERLEPWFVEFKGSARAEVPSIRAPGGAARTTAAPPANRSATLASSNTGGASRAPSPPPSRTTPARSSSSGEAQSSSGTNRGRDRVSARWVREGVSRFSDKLPIPISARLLVEKGADLNGGRLQEGQVALPAADADPEASDAVTQFVVPDGVRLLQLYVDRTVAGSIFGRSLQFARETVAPFTVQDTEGEQYHRIGEIRIADVRGTETIEMQYWPNAEMPERCIRDFRTVKKNDMTGEYSLIYLYLIPDGRQPEKFNVGGGKLRSIGRIEND